MLEQNKGPLSTQKPKFQDDEGYSLKDIKYLFNKLVESKQVKQSESDPDEEEDSESYQIKKALKQRKEREEKN